MSDIQEPVGEAIETVTRTDRLGRILEIRELDALEEMDLMEAGGEAANNRRWFRNAVLAACVRKIDGLPQPFPKKRATIRAQVAAVGNAGISAVLAAEFDRLPAAVQAELLGDDNFKIEQVVSDSQPLSAEVQTAKN